MQRIILGLSAIAATLALVAPAQATALRTFVSSTGNDANTASSCIATAPCRTLAAAFSVTQDKGHIFMTDVAGYGALTITRSVTLVAIDGALIGVPTGGTGIIINAGVNDDVTIDGLILDGAGVGTTGIAFNTGKSLTVKKSTIRGMTTHGILFNPNASSTLLVSDTMMTGNGGSGIRSQPTGSGGVKMSLSRVEIHNSGAAGFRIFGGGTGTIVAVMADSVLVNNVNGITAESSSALTNVMVTRSVVAHNGTGLFVSGAAVTLRIGQSALTGNMTSWSTPAGGTLRSYGDNNIDGNDDGDPAPTAIGKK